MENGEYVIVMTEFGGGHIENKFWAGNTWTADLAEAKVYSILNREKIQEALRGQILASRKNVSAYELGWLKNHPHFNWLDFKETNSIDFENGQG